MQKIQTKIFGKRVEVVNLQCHAAAVLVLNSSFTSCDMNSCTMNSILLIENSLYNEKKIKKNGSHNL